MTQRELAEAAGVSYVTVNHLENDRRIASDRVTRLLAKALRVKPASMLFPGDDLKTPTQILKRELRRYERKRSK